MLILSQSSWSPFEPKEFASVVGAARREVDRQRGDNKEDALLLLPHSPNASMRFDTMSEEDVFQLLGTVAKQHQLFIAGSAVMLAAKARTPQTIGFLVAPDGEVCLRVLKVSPDLIEGFTDTTSALGQPAEFPVANLSFANIGMLCGEQK
jgi:hypothetical protein